MRSLTLMLDGLFFPLGLASRVAIIAVVLAVIAAIAYYRRMLDRSGIAAALIIGFIVFFIGGISGFVVFLFFFLSSSVVTKACRGSGKGHPRTASQVVANGLPAALALLSYAAFSYPHGALVAFAAAVAEASADTWAGEIGQLSHKDPVSIVTFTRVPKGISGGVTVLGLSASVLSSLLIAILYIGTFGGSLSDAAIITSSGFLGALLDSFLGATIQAKYRDEDGTLTEEATDDRVRGIPFIDNDAVNLISGLFSLSLGAALSLL